MHTHIIPKQIPNFRDKFGYGDFVYLDHHKPGQARMIKGQQFFREIGQNCWDPQIRIDEYAKYHTQVQVVSTIPVMFSYWAQPAHCLEVSRFLNDHIANLVASYPKNYLGLGTLPMHDSLLAVKELERIKHLGLSGIQIGSNVNNQNLHETSFWPIWEACESLGLAVMVHPWEMMGQEHMPKYWLPWLVGMPAETSRAICSMIFGGVFDRYPKLRVNFSHAGGSFFGTLGRIHHGHHCRPDLVAVDNPTAPLEYLNRFWIDCITHDLNALKYILGMLASDKVCLGSDYPFPLGDLEIGDFVAKSDLDDKTKQDIFSRAALAWLHLEANYFE
ncbi:MAG: amidohydrolase [Bacteroidetes bacterium]|nr:amidohydrolase [Bacteroidota bacterium]